MTSCSPETSARGDSKSPACSLVDSEGRASSETCARHGPLESLDEPSPEERRAPASDGPMLGLPAYVESLFLLLCGADITKLTERALQEDASVTVSLDARAPAASATAAYRSRRYW